MRLQLATPNTVAPASTTTCHGCIKACLTYTHELRRRAGSALEWTTRMPRLGGGDLECGCGSWRPSKATRARGITSTLL